MLEVVSEFLKLFVVSEFLKLSSFFKFVSLFTDCARYSRVLLTLSVLFSFHYFFANFLPPIFSVLPL